MTGVVKPGFSPRKGKDNKSLPNNVSSTTPKKNAKNVAKKDSKSQEAAQNEEKRSPEKVNHAHEKEETNSTSKRSVRPQTKVLRRPTPNLNHPVIQVDSDDSSSSDKSKEENPKRMRVGKNFVAFNKRNVSRRRTVPSSKEEGSDIASSPIIPNPCHSCSRSKAPERLHSHARKDARGLMYQRKVDIVKTEPEEKEGETKISEDLKVAQLSEKLGNQQKTAEMSTPEPTKACYICRTSVQVSLLLMHENKCLENWKKSNNSLSPNLRQLPPRRPADGTAILGASENDWCAVQSQLVPCPLCSRTFFPERLPVHSRVCKGGQSPKMLKRASSLKENSVSPTGEAEESKPMYLPCNVCGRSFGSWVLTVHEQQCLRKKKKQAAKVKDTESNDIKETPQPISTSGKILREDRVSDPISDKLATLGESAWRNHLQQLVPCSRCSRTFFPDRLEVHERSCKGERRPNSNRIPR